MNKYIFLDTNIYDEASFSFENPRMTALSKLINDNDLSLLMCSVCKGEVKKHIITQMTECVQGLNKQLKERYWASLRFSKKYESKLKKLVATDVISDTMALFEDFLAINNVLYFSVADIDVEALINDHFNQIYPFEPSKPDEFKDAIMTRALISYQLTLGDEIDIVSKDEGFRKTFEGKSGFEVYTSLDEWIEHSQSETTIQTLSDLFDELVIDNSIQEDLEDKITDIECSFDERIDYDFNSSTVENTILEFKYAYFINENEILVMTTGITKLIVHSRYLDETNSFYSSEDKDYIFRRYIDSKESHRIENDVMLKFLVVQPDTESDEDCEVSFEYSGIESFPYESLDLSEDTLVNVLEEEEEGDDPDNLVYCSQCGKVLGLSENGCFYTSDYEPLCDECCITDDKGFICPSCGLKHPYSDETGDGICRDCFLEQE